MKILLDECLPSSPPSHWKTQGGDDIDFYVVVTASTQAKLSRCHHYDGENHLHDLTANPNSGPGAPSAD